MITYKVTYDVTIPVYDGTTDGQIDFLRPTTFKGVLRFWWRALIFGRFHNLLKDDDAALEAMKRCENHLFGSSDQKIGQARLKIGSLISIENAHNNNRIHKKPGLDYFAGQGMENDRSLSVSRFKVTLRLKDDRPNVKAIKAEDWPLALETMDDALIVLGLIGGLGKKSRKGFGSLSIQEMTKNDSPVDCDISDDKKYEELIIKHLGSSRRYKPKNPFGAPFTCINNHIRICKVIKNSDPVNCLQQMGWAYKYHRSNGTSDKGGRQVVYNVIEYKDNNKTKYRKDLYTVKNKDKCTHWGDHDWMEAVFNLAEEKRQKHEETKVDIDILQDFQNDYEQIINGKNELLLPQRFAFGLPHVYRSTSSKKRAYNTISVSCKTNRRASPLFFHVQRIASRSLGVVIVIPSNFAPSVKITVKGKNKPPLYTNIDMNMGDVQTTYDKFLKCFKEVPHLKAQLYKNGKPVYENTEPVTVRKKLVFSDEQDIRHD